MLMCMLGLTGLDQIHAAEKTETGKTPSKTIKFTPRLAKGDRFVLEITKSKTQNGRSLSQGMRGSQIIDIEIVKSGGPNLLLGWTIRRTGVVDPDGKLIALSPRGAALMTIFDGVQILFEFSPEYELLGVKNLKQVKPLFLKVIDKVFEDMKASPREKAKYRRGFTSMLNSDKGIEGFFSKELALLMQLARLELSREDATEFEYESPLPIGKGVITSKVVAQVKDLNRTAGRATVAVNSKADPEKTAKAMTAAARAMAKQMGQPASVVKDIPKVDMRSESTYVIDLKTNLPLSIDRKQTVAMGPRKQSEIVKIVRKPAKAAKKQKLRK
jgi:hypothetical protein